MKQKSWKRLERTAALFLKSLHPRSHKSSVPFPSRFFHAPATYMSLALRWGARNWGGFLPFGFLPFSMLNTAAQPRHIFLLNLKFLSYLLNFFLILQF